MSAPSDTGNRELVLRLPRSALRIGAIAFGAGLLLFVIVWWAGRDQGFYKVEPVASQQPKTAPESLPEPLAAGDSISGMEQPRQSGSDEPAQLLEAPPAPASIEPAPAGAAPPVDPGTAAGATAPLPAAAAAGGDVPVPIPGQNPPPAYPAAAMRRSETGTVVVRVQVDASGAPGGVALIRRSGSRDLDRAAMEAVRRWRFQPAQRDGVPVAGSVDIPIDFSLQR